MVEDQACPIRERSEPYPESRASDKRVYVPSLCISWDGQVVQCLKERGGFPQITNQNSAALGARGLLADVPPSQTALRPCTRRVGSFAISSIALSGLGCRSMMVCSKRGPDWPAGRGLWLVDQVAARLGDWGARDGTDLASAAGTAGVDAGVEE
jgi:hypothetical protein